MGRVARRVQVELVYVDQVGRVYVHGIGGVARQLGTVQLVIVDEIEAVVGCV